MGFNKIILIGNCLRDVEIRYTQSGTAIAKTGLAVNRRFKGQNGEQKDETMFIDLTIFGRSAEIANQYLGKGRKVLAEGRLVLEQWTDQNGQNRSKHSIAVENLQFLDSKEAEKVKIEYQNKNGEKTDITQNKNFAQNKYTHQEIDMNNDNIPF